MACAQEMKRAYSGKKSKEVNKKKKKKEASRKAKQTSKQYT